MWIGLILSFVIGFLVIFSLVLKHTLYVTNKVTGISIRKALSGLIYRKCLKLKKRACTADVSSQIMTIIGTELTSFEEGLGITPYIVIAPYSTVLAFAVIAIAFKEAVVLGVIIYIFFVLIQIMTSRITTKWNYIESNFSDKRLKVISDCINEIKIIKAYAWEHSYQRLINKWRL